MRMYRLFFVALTFSCGLVGAPQAFAFDPAQTYVQPQFLPPQLLPPPPEEGSPGWRKQADLVLKAQSGMPSSDVNFIKDEAHLRLELLTSLMGPNFTRENLPKTFNFLDHVLASTEQVSEADKKFWHTRRPYLTDPHIKLYVDPIDASPSYPSGHTAGSRVLAEVLGMIAPDKLPALRARADAIAKHRVEAGVHYPGDLEGGRTLAMLVIGSMMANDDFQDDLIVARKEIGSK